MKAKSTAKKSDSIQQKAKVKRAGARGAIQTQTKEVLQHSDLLWHSIFSAANDAIMILDDKYNIIVANQKASQMYGLTELELAGMSLRDLRADPLKDLAQTQMEDAIRRGGMLWETIHRRKDGTLFPVEVSTKSIVIDGQRKFVHMIRDISQRKQAKEARRSAEGYLRTVLNNAPITIFAIDREGIFRLSEGKALEKAGLKPGENVGVSANELYDSLRVIQPDDHVITGREVIERVFAGETLTGITKLNNAIYENQFVPLRDSSDQIIGLVGVATDITERRHAEEKIAFQAKLLDQVGNAVTATDPRGRVTYWNPAAEKLYGWTASEAMGKNILEITPSQQIQEQAAQIMEDLRMGKSWSGEFLVRRKDGATFPVYVSGSPMIDHNGNLTGIIGVSKDITKRVKAQEKLKKAHEELRALTARLSEVEENERQKLTRELHDRVGQTLTALNINLNIIRDQISEESVQKVGLRIDDSILLVEEAVMHMRNVMADLHPPVLDDYGLTAALSWYAKRFSKMTEIPVRVEENWESSGTRLNSQLEMILFRIAQEALTNTALHAKARQIIIRLESLDEIVRMTVEDDGCGFDPSKGKESGSRSGWGLRIMRERIEVVGGNFRLESTPGQGAKIVAEINPGIEVAE